MIRVLCSSDAVKYMALTWSVGAEAGVDLPTLPSHGAFMNVWCEWAVEVQDLRCHGSGSEWPCGVARQKGGLGAKVALFQFVELH